MRVVISGGGTGGHLFPALAVADEIKKRDSSSEILFVGTSSGLESRLVPQAGYRFEAARGAGVAGTGISGAVSGVFASALGIVKSMFLLRGFSPDVAVGMGGYASFPAIAAAWVMGIPVAVCEQNSVPGLANGMLGRVAQRVFLSFPPPGGVFPSGFAPEKVRISGNPVRREIAAAALRRRTAGRSPQPDGCVIFVIGGSRGASSLNRVVPGAIASFKKLTRKNISVIHQTGLGAVCDIERTYRSAGVSARVFDFDPVVADFYVESDLVISRAGAGAISEIALFSKPSILVPYPFAARDHQRANAKMMERAGAAFVIEEDVLSEKAVAETLQRLLNWNMLEAMSKAVSAIAAPDAAKNIVDEIEILAGK